MNMNAASGSGDPLCLAGAAGPGSHRVLRPEPGKTHQRPDAGRQGRVDDAVRHHAGRRAGPERTAARRRHQQRQHRIGALGTTGSGTERREPLERDLPATSTGSARFSGVVYTPAASSAHRGCLRRRRFRVGGWHLSRPRARRQPQGGLLQFPVEPDLRGDDHLERGHLGHSFIDCAFTLYGGVLPYQGHDDAVEI